jgi:hypothetical protein
MATKKITELPLITRISGSQEYGGSVLPVVVGGTTNQISAENFSRFVNAYDAQTGSQNIFTQNQWFNTIVSASTINVGTLGVGGNTTIAGTLGVGGNGTIGGNLAVAGRITAEEFYTEITTASVIYASGSTKFGDDTGDKHEFTGSINVSGSVIYNGVILTNIDANTIQKLQQTTQSLQVATASLQTFTASQDDRNFILSQVTGSFAGELSGLEAYTASLKTAAIVSSSTQIQNYNLFAVTSSDNTFYGTQRITGSLSVSSGQFNVMTGSGGLTSSLRFTHNITSPGDGNAILELRHNNRIYNDDIAIKLKADFAGAYLDYEEDTVPYSILSVQSFANKNVYIHQDTRLLFSNLTVDDNLVVKQDTKMTGSLFVMGVITGSILATNGVISSSNQLFELNQFTASQDGRNFTLSQVTGSLIGITNGLMAFTAALDNTYATDAQLYQLYQSTRSLELHSGSMVGVTNGLMAYTASLKGQAIVSSSTQIQNYDVFALNSNLYNGTGSIKAEIAGIEAYTASLKAQSIISSSQQISNLGFATTSSVLGSGLISSSTQISNFGFPTTSSQDTLSNKTLSNPLIGSFNITSDGLSRVGTYGNNVEIFSKDGLLINPTTDRAVYIDAYDNNNKVVINSDLASYLPLAGGSLTGGLKVTGSLVVSGSSRGNIISGGLDVNGGITGSFKGNLAGVADYASTIAISNTGTTTDTNLFPTFTSNPVLGSYSNLYSHASSSFFLNGVTRRVHMEGFVVSGSNNIAEITGSLNVVGNTILSGSINISGSTTFTGVHTLNGTNIIIGNTVMSGSIEVSGSSNFRNSLFILTGSSFLTGSHDVKGNTTVTGSFNVSGQTTLSGSINIASGSGFYRAGNKLFNYGAFYDTTTQSGSANVSSSIKFNSTDYSEGVSISNNTRIVLENIGVYNIQFSAQLVDSGAGSSTIHIWIMKNGANVPNSAGRIFLKANEEVIAAWNYVVPATSPNDYYELVWQSTDADARILYEAATGNIPAIPSIILTVTQVA